MIKKLEFNGEQQYLDMLKTILDDGAFEGDERTGTGTYDVFGYQMRFDLTKGEIPLLTTKKMYTKGIIAELAWFCQGRTDIKWLIERKSNFWNADAHRVYCKDWEENQIQYLKNIAGVDEYVDFVNGVLKDKDKDMYDFYIKHGVTKDSFYRPFTMKEFKQRILENDNFNAAFGDLGKVYGHQWTNWEKVAGSDYVGTKSENPLIRTPNESEIIQGINCSYYIVEIDSFSRNCMIQFLDDNASIKYATLDDVPLEFARDGQISNPYRQRESINQLQECIDSLKNAPAGRRIITTAWNPSDIGGMALPPCHMMFQFSSHKLTFEQRKEIYLDHGHQELIDSTTFSMEKEFDELGIPQRSLSCHMYQRSCDSFLGVPFNIASYSILVHIIANICNMQPKEFIWSSGSTHIYTNHLDQVKEQIKREPKGFPTLKMNRSFDNLSDFSEEDFEIVGYEFHDKIKAELNVG